MQRRQELQRAVERTPENVLLELHVAKNSHDEFLLLAQRTKQLVVGFECARSLVRPETGPSQHEALLCLTPCFSPRSDNLNRRRFSVDFVNREPGHKKLGGHFCKTKKKRTNLFSVLV
jgi:hypothetical protein